MDKGVTFVLNLQLSELETENSRLEQQSENSEYSLSTSRQDIGNGKTNQNVLEGPRNICSNQTQVDPEYQAEQLRIATFQSTAM